MSLSYYLTRSKSQYWPMGEVSFKKFYTEYGWLMLNQLINKEQTDMLENLSVKRSDGKELTIEQFLDEVKQYQIIEEK